MNVALIPTRVLRTAVALFLAFAFSSVAANAQMDPAADSRHDALPKTLTLPANTQLQLRTVDAFSSDTTASGHFIAVLVQPVVVDGWVVARAGEFIVGDAAPAPRNADNSSAGYRLKLSKFLLVDGRVTPVQTEPVNVAANIPLQSSLTFTVTQPVTVETNHGRSAFRVVTQEDYVNYPFGPGPTKIPPGYDPPCCVDHSGVGAFAGDGYGYPYYYSAGYFPPPVIVPYYGWHGTRWGW